MKRISIPGLAALSPRSGIGRVVHNLEAHLSKEVVLSNLNYRTIDLPLVRNFPVQIIGKQPETVVFPQLTGVRNVKILKKTNKSVAIIHDIGIVDCVLDKNLLNPISRAMVMYDLYCLKYIDLIVAVSEFTRNRLIKYYPGLEEKIVVVPNSLGESFISFTTEKAVSKRETCRMLNIGLESEILLYVGTELPRKNLTLLFDTLIELKKTNNRIILIKAGGPGGEHCRKETLYQINARGLKLEKDIFIRDNISEEELLGYYNSATATVLPSLYEGFGLPVIESLALKTPIVAADGSAMNEIASRHAMIHTPNTQCFKNAIVEIIANGLTGKQKEGMASIKSEYSPQNQANLLYNKIEAILK